MRKWRVGTISMGILLMATGLMLLISELQGFDGARMILRWWPVILIVLGLEILVYIFFSREEQPQIKYDGLSIFFVILIILVSSGVYAVNSFLQSDFSQGILGEIGYFKNETIINQSYKIDAAKVKKLQIDNNKGLVKVDKYDGSAIKVDVAIIIKNNNEENAHRLAQDLIDVTEGETLSLNTRGVSLLEDNRNYQVTINYAVKVPKELIFDIQNNNGEITLGNLTGDVKVKSEFSRVEVENLQGDLLIENSYGETRVKNITGKVEIENENGEIFYGSKQVAKQDISLSCKMGGIILELPSDQQGFFRVSTQSGEISMEGFQAEFSINRDDAKQELKGTIGQNSPVISLTAEEGSINLKGK